MQNGGQDRGIVKLADCSLFPEFFYEAKPLTLRRG